MLVFPKKNELNSNRRINTNLNINWVLKWVQTFVFKVSFFVISRILNELSKKNWFDFCCKLIYSVIYYRDTSLFGFIYIIYLYYDYNGHIMKVGRFPQAIIIHTWTYMIRGSNRYYKIRLPELLGFQYLCLSKLVKTSFLLDSSKILILILISTKRFNPTL